MGGSVTACSGAPCVQWPRAAEPGLRGQGGQAGQGTWALRMPTSTAGLQMRMTGSKPGPQPSEAMGTTCSLPQAAGVLGRPRVCQGGAVLGKCLAFAGILLLDEAPSATPPTWSLPGSRLCLSSS